jgi:ectoine hydroxylase-related dioxygenase (phytanoyl-CoA dioxygenase family)
MSYEYEKYICPPDKVKEWVDQYGVAVVKGVLDKDEIKDMRDGMWSYLEHTTQKFEKPIKKDDPSSWVEYQKLYPKHSMLLQQYQVGHSKFVWNIRENPRVVDIFSKIWSTKPEDLLTSFDGASFHFPPEETNRGWYRQTWYHTDQSYLRPEFECIQSWVTGYDVDEGDATLAFMEGSNKYHREFQEVNNINDKSDWYKHSSEEQKFYEDKGCGEKRIKCKAGDMVFWDSRTIHCGTEAVRMRDKPNLRNVVYVCMTPREKVTDANLRKKMKAFNELRMTSHWPHKPKLFPKNPRTYGGPLPNVTEIEKPELTELGKRIAGFK